MPACMGRRAPGRLHRVEDDIGHIHQRDHADDVAQLSQENLHPLQANGPPNVLRERAEHHLAVEVLLGLGGRAGACTNERDTSDAARAHGYVGRRAAGRRGGSKATAREEAGSRLSEPAADSKMRRPQPTGDVRSEGSPAVSPHTRSHQTARLWPSRSSAQHGAPAGGGGGGGGGGGCRTAAAARR